MRERLDWKRTLGFCLVFSGMIGLAYFIRSMPPTRGPILEVAKWAFGTTLFAVVSLSGFPGVLHQRLTSMHLKVLDLIWVLASAFSVALGVVYVFQHSADDVRQSLEKNIEISRSQAIRQVAYAYSFHCGETSNFTAQQCTNLRTLAAVLNSQGYISPQIVQSVCPLPIDFGDPPAGFSPTLIDGCISANYAAVAATDPIFLDKQNFEKWKMYLDLWPLLLIFLVALRVMKSVAEVFWKIKL